MKKIVLGILVAFMVTVSGITALAYWKDELKVKAGIPLLYNVEIEVKGDAKEQKNNESEVPEQNDITIKPEQSEKSNTENIKEESATKESMKEESDKKESVKEETDKKESMKEESDKKESTQDTEYNVESKVEVEANHE
jgi:hypothetical protein